jgi:hypothetical protein
MTPAASYYAELAEVAAEASGGPVDRGEMEQAAAYADPLDPARWFRDVLGEEITTRDQDRLLDAFVDGDGLGRYCLKGGHGTGKSHRMGRVILFVWTCRGAILGADGEPMGCKVILTAPTGSSIRGTVYAQILDAARVAVSRGFWIPGYLPRAKDRYRGPSTREVNWHQDAPRWEMIGITASAQAGGGLAHSAGGSHHAGWQVVAAEETEGIRAEMLNAMAGLGTAGNVLTMAATNPTNSLSRFAGVVLGSPDAWSQVSFSQVTHPNVLERREVIRGGISHLDLEAAMRGASFEDRGSDAVPDPRRLDFWYALPPADMPDAPGPRADGIPGHPGAAPHVYRPTSALVAGQRLGDWLQDAAGALLFNVSLIRDLMGRGLRQPSRPPDAVGVDCAGARPPWACPRWGPTARAAYDSGADPGAIYVGRPVEISYNGTDELSLGADSARDLVERWGLTPTYVFDQAFGGRCQSSVAAMGAATRAVPFGGKPTGSPLPLYAPPANQRVQMHTEAAAAANGGLIAWAWSEELLVQMRALGGLVLPLDGTAKTANLAPKKDLTEPMDRLDAAVLALSSSVAESSGGSFGPWG